MADHIFLNGDHRKEQSFTSRQTPVNKKRSLDRQSREQHAAMLFRQLSEAWEASAGAPPEEAIVTLERQLGVYLSFAVRKSHSDSIKSLMQENKGIYIRTVADGTGDLSDAVIVTVWVPKDEHRFFYKKLDDFRNITKFSAEILPENKDLIIKLAREKNYKRAQAKPVKSGIKFHVEVPEKDIKTFLEEFGDKFIAGTEKFHPVQEALVTSIDKILTTLLDHFCPFGLPEGDDAEWLEVWLATEMEERKQKEDQEDRASNNEAHQIVEERFRELAQSKGMEVSNERLVFPDRVVLLSQMTRDQANELLMSSDDIAEFRPAESCAGYIYREGKEDQNDLMNESLSRVQWPIDPIASVCILDTGANNAHPMLEQLLDDSDCHTVEPDWETHDHHGHGTEMAGLAAYGGDFGEKLISNKEIQLTHVLESVKLLPPQGHTDPHLWAELTDQATARASLSEKAAKRQRCFSMSITSNLPNDKTHAGRPSSWSGGIDQIAYSHRDHERRLFIISAGNATGDGYPDQNLARSVESPGQAWNALTVGAYTEKIQISPEHFPNHEPLAKKGELSPYSTTGLEWEPKWPNKPDVVFEGGNLAVNKANQSLADPDDLVLLTTNKDFISKKPFTLTWGTSAACALASHLAGALIASYPKAWPETIRGLIVHSAEWTPAMKKQFLSEKARDESKPRKQEYARLLKIVGHGVPNYHKARECGDNTLTLISEQTIKPFKKITGKGGKYNHMHLHRLPWPREILESLGEQPISVKVTLSYFIDPSPEGRAWAQRYRYQSHAFRFAMKKPGQSEEDFVSSINAEALDNEDGNPVSSTSGKMDKWRIEEATRFRGSVHSDTIPKERLTAVELADCNLIAVYPVVGWFRERLGALRYDETVRYSLIVSIETEKEDIYTTVKEMVDIPVATTV